MQTSCKGAAKEILRQIKNIFSLFPLQSSSQNTCTPLQEYKKQKSVEKPGKNETSEYTESNAFCCLSSRQNCRQGKQSAGKEKTQPKSILR